MKRVEEEERGGREGTRIRVEGEEVVGDEVDGGRVEEKQR